MFLLILMSCLHQSDVTLDKDFESNAMLMDANRVHVCGSYSIIIHSDPSSMASALSFAHIDEEIKLSTVFISTPGMLAMQDSETYPDPRWDTPYERQLFLSIEDTLSTHFDASLLSLNIKSVRYASESLIVPHIKEAVE